MANIVESVKKKFESQLSSFPLNKQWHYCERLYRITGNPIYEKPIKNYFLAKKEEFLELVNSFGNKKRMHELGGKYIQEIKKKKTPRIVKRILVYQKIPEFKYNQELVWFLSKLSDYDSLDQFLTKDKLEELLLKLKKVNFLKYFMNTQLMKVDPVQTINTVFYLRRLKVVDWTKKVVQKVRSIFKRISTVEEYQNKLYFLTHTIIASTNYYQDFVKTEQYKWIFTFFEKEQENILKLKNNDIIAEIGVCLKLAKIRNSFLERIESRIKEEISRGDGILLRERKNKIFKLDLVEHRNVLAILLLSNWVKLYKGPHLDFNK